MFGQGDNGRVYELQGEDKLFKITTETEEYRVAEQIANQFGNYSTFIPVYYVDGHNMYIMAKASDLSEKQRMNVSQFIENYKTYARDEGGDAGEIDAEIGDGGFY